MDEPTPQRHPNKPNKLEGKLRARFLGLLAAGMTISDAARACNLNRDTPYRRMTADPLFKQAVEEAELVACEAIESALKRTALAGNVRAQLAWLYNRSPARWQDRRAAPVVTIAPIGSETLATVQAELLARLQQTNTPSEDK